MKVSGEATLHASIDKVYAALHDPGVLVRTIPGCERLEQVGPDSYRMVLTAGVAAVKGTYSGEVVLADQQAPHAFRLTASGAGAPGTVSTEVQVRLAEGADGTTVLSYDADAVVGGPVGGVGQRILAGVAKKTANEFFAAVDAILTGAAASTREVRAGAVHAEEAVALATYTRPARAGRALPDFAAGVAVGAAAALLGVLVGALVSRRPKGE